MNLIVKDITNQLCEKYPNRRIFVISDQHFFHSNIIEFSRPNFANDGVDYMNSYIINAHNSVITDDDIVFFLGDFSFINSRIAEINQKLNGHKFLILGNHDDFNFYRNKSLGFEGVFIHPVQFEKMLLSHEPICENASDANSKLIYQDFEKNKLINYHGHIHIKEQIDERHINCTCEALDYVPKYIGRTRCNQNRRNKYLIEHDNFNDILHIISGINNSISPNILIMDYIYSLILSFISTDERFNTKAFINGSYTYFKKYGMIFRPTSDLDISLLDIENQESRYKLEKLLRELLHYLFLSINDINGLMINVLKFLKNIRISEVYYWNNDVHCKAFIDANCVNSPVYRPSDFIQFDGMSKIEQLMHRYNISVSDSFVMPSFRVNFMNTTSDIVNILLQYLYQTSSTIEEKKHQLKKIRYILNTKDVKIDDSIIEDTMIRFLIRNILFFNMCNREKEIESINSKEIHEKELVWIGMSKNLAHVYDVLLSEGSLYNQMLREIKSYDVSKTVEASKGYIKAII